MKVLFICGSLEEGKDGIGDYTRSLSRGCTLEGLLCVLVAVNDRYVTQVEAGATGENIPFYRIPQQLTWKEKGAILSEIIKANSPVDWISIQFVSYGFNKKGVIWKEMQFFRQLKGIKTHVMMHELWVGEEKEASVKMKVLGKIQRRGIFAMLRCVKPRVVQTSIPLYKKILEVSGISATILPLFSNIGYHHNDTPVLTAEIPQSLLNEKDKYLVGCLFGSIYYDSWDLSSLFTILKREKGRHDKEIMIVSIGKIGFGKQFWDNLPSQYPDVNFLTLGPQEEQFISYWLKHFVDFGIITTPAIVAGKSGSCMAFLEHGLPVVCKKNTLSFNFDVSENIIDGRIIQVSEQDELMFPAHTGPSAQIKNTVHGFIQTLNAFQ